jgi:hypothetical protein
VNQSTWPRVKEIFAEASERPRFSVPPVSRPTSDKILRAPSCGIGPARDLGEVLQ